MPPKYVDAKELLKIFSPPPSMRWLRTQTANGTIPYLKIGRKVFFDRDLVIQYFEKRQTVRARRQLAA